MNLFLALFSRRWLLATVLVVAASLVMARLGVWQLDRLATRREFNARALEWVDGPLLILDADALQLDLYNMEYRPVEVTGTFVLDDQVALKNQQHNNKLGVSLLTPLWIDGADEAVLVLRGWIPQEDSSRVAWRAYDESGVFAVRGVLRRSQPRADFGNLIDPTPGPGEPRLDLWFSANVAQIADQSVTPLRGDVYVQLIPDDAVVGLPARQSLALEISEGSHMGYALQWFTFSLILLLGYPVFVFRQENV